MWCDLRRERIHLILYFTDIHHKLLIRDVSTVIFLDLWSNDVVALEDVGSKGFEWRELQL